MKLSRPAHASTGVPSTVKCPSEVRPRSRASASTRSKNNTATQDAFVTKLNPLGTAPLVYSTYLGGNDQRDPAEDGFGIAIDGAGEAHVTGRTGSTDFPTTPGAYQTSYGGGIHDAFVTKLDATGSALVYSTYVGGGDNDIGYGIALDGSGSAYVTGTTASDHFPTTSGAFQQSPQGGSGLEQDAFVTKLNAAGSAPLIYSTYLGGSDDERGLGIAVDLQLPAGQRLPAHVRRGTSRCLRHQAERPRLGARLLQLPRRRRRRRRIPDRPGRNAAAERLRRRPGGLGISDDSRRLPDELRRRTRGCIRGQGLLCTWQTHPHSAHGHQSGRHAALRHRDRRGRRRNPRSGRDRPIHGDRVGERQRVGHHR
ncbi:MAG: hypothetical protein DMF80_04400 [Acidobacteria bacterium]|nr:MAG: hypothetical protein DMF80_04400 [Acidobacteriota bacterium]